MGYKVLLAGQDITNFVSEETIDVESALGQGAGTAGNSGGRAATATFTTSLGPAAQAYGAGQVLPRGGPFLVRQGEVKIYDASSTLIYHGYAAKLDDKTDTVNVFTEIECYDDWQDLDRVSINELFINVTDVYVINYLLSKYAPLYNRPLLPAPTFTFPRLIFRGTTLQKALQKIADTTGFQVYITPDLKVHYRPLSAASTAPFQLSEHNVDDVHVVGMSNIDFEQDDNAIINRVLVVGGYYYSSNFTQYLDAQNTTGNLTFSLAYQPFPSSDGLIHVTSNGAELVVGYANSSDALKSAGGTKDVLINQDQQTALFNAQPTNPVHAVYKYKIPLVVQLTDEASHTFFGRYFDTTVLDSSIIDIPTGIQRGRALLAQQNYGLATLTCSIRIPGLQAGMLVQVNHNIRGIHATFQVQKVTYKPQGNGVFFYDLELGAWKWNLADIFTWLDRNSALAAMADSTNNSEEAVVQVSTASSSLHASTAWVNYQRTHGGYYARTAPLGDGHDAYAGLFTIAS
jgi:hypothetical protein